MKKRVLILSLLMTFCIGCKQRDPNVFSIGSARISSNYYFIAEAIAENAVDVGRDDVLAHSPQVLLIDVSAYGVIDMHCSLAVVHREADSRVETFFERIDRRVFGYNILRLLGDHFLYQRWKVTEVVVERVAVDTAVLDYILYGDLIHRLVVQQLQSRCFNSLFRKICQSLSFLIVSLFFPPMPGKDMIYIQYQKYRSTTDYIIFRNKIQPFYSFICAQTY